MADKTKMKRVLYELADEDERREMELAEMIEFNENSRNFGQKVDGQLSGVQASLNTLRGAIEGGAKKSEIREMVSELNKEIANVRADSVSGSKETAQAIREMQKEVSGSLAALRTTMAAIAKILTIGATGSDINKNAGPLYKTMINHLAGMESAFKTWKYPQYASVSVRNKSFANINPAIDERATSVGDGTQTVITNGTAVQVVSTSTLINRVVIQAHESNTGTIVVGGSDVKAALVGRKGWALYPTNSQEFKVSDLSLLWIDSTANGDKINYYYEAS